MTISECIKRGIRYLLGGCVLLAFLVFIWEIGPIITFAGDCLSNISSPKIWLEHFKIISASEDKMAVFELIMIICAGASIVLLATISVNQEKILSALENILSELKKKR